MADGSARQLVNVALLADCDCAHVAGFVGSAASVCEFAARCCWGTGVLAAGWRILVAGFGRVAAEASRLLTDAAARLWWFVAVEAVLVLAGYVSKSLLTRRCRQCSCVRMCIADCQLQGRYGCVVLCSQVSVAVCSDAMVAMGLSCRQVGLAERSVAEVVDVRNVDVAVGMLGHTGELGQCCLGCGCGLARYVGMIGLGRLGWVYLKVVLRQDAGLRSEC